MKESCEHKLLMHIGNKGIGKEVIVPMGECIKCNERMIINKEYQITDDYYRKKRLYTK